MELLSLYDRNSSDEGSVKPVPHLLMQTSSPFGIRTAGWPVCLRHQASFWPPHMHRPVTLLRWRFGPQPPNANAGVTADDSAAERTTNPSSVAEIFFMIRPPFSLLKCVAKQFDHMVRPPELGMNAAATECRPIALLCPTLPAQPTKCVMH